MHSLTHVDESQKELYECPYKNCNRTYHYKKNMKEHIRSFHEKSKKKIELNCTEPGCQTFVATYVRNSHIFFNFIKCYIFAIFQANLKRHLTQVHKTKFKRKKTRKIRCDAGKPKEPIAAALSGINVNREIVNLLPVRQSIQDIPETANNNEKSKENEPLNILKNNEIQCETKNNILVINCDILDSNNILENDDSLLKNVEFFPTCTNISSENF